MHVILLTIAPQNEHHAATMALQVFKCAVIFVLLHSIVIPYTNNHRHPSLVEYMMVCICTAA